MSWLFDTDGRLNRLRRHRAADPAETFVKDQSYLYDTNGNRTKDERGTHEFNAKDQLVEWTRSPGRSPGSRSRARRSPTGSTGRAR